MLFTLLMRDEFIFYKTTKSSLQLLPNPYTECWVGFSSSTAGGSTGASGSDSGAALFASEPSSSLSGWQILPSQNLLLLQHCPCAVLLIKYLNYQKTVCVNQNVTRSCSIWQSSRQHVERAGDNLYSSTMTAELSSPHLSKENFCNISRNLFFLSLISSK